MKTCGRCGGRGATMGHEINVLGWDQSVPQPCPCLTDRLARYERALKQISGEIPMPMGEDEEILEHHWRIAKAALEDT